jgi:hypothetical protein
MKALGYSLALLTLAGCLHRSPEADILAAFGDDESALADDSGHVGYVVFQDSITAAVFRNLVHSGRVRVAPKAQLPFCSAVKVDGIHGALVRAKVDSVMSDSAFASLVRTCRSIPPPPLPKGQLTFGSFGGTQIERTVYLMVRKNGKWIVAKPLYANISEPM